MPELGRSALRAATRSVVADYLEGQPQLGAEPVDEHTWFFVLRGERKRTIPVWCEVGERTTVLRSFFMRAPDENEGALFRYLLQRHLRSYVFRFCLAPDGDVLLVGLLPNSAVDHGEVDRLIGQLLVTADAAFESAVRLGFAAYIEREQAWRRRTGAPPNPIT